MPGEHFVFSIEDERYRSITLSAERLEHITTAHPELEDPALIPLLIAAVEAPNEIHHGSPGEEWF